MKDSSQLSHRYSPPKEVLLSVVMPVHNEVVTIEKVLREWIEYLNEEIQEYEIIIINDGSRDGSGRVLDRLRKEFACLRVIHQLQGGHERAIRRGYEAVRGKHVFQLDPNGRYEPTDFSKMWEMRRKYDLIIGRRTHRLDHVLSRALSRILHFVTKLLFKCTFSEPNIAFRLYEKTTLLSYLSHLPRSYEFINLALTVLIHKDNSDRMKEIPVPFRFPHGGKRRATLGASAGAALHVIAELLRLRTSLLKAHIHSTYFKSQRASA